MPKMETLSQMVVVRLASDIWDLLLELKIRRASISSTKFSILFSKYLAAPSSDYCRPAATRTGHVVNKTSIATLDTAAEHESRSAT